MSRGLDRTGVGPLIMLLVVMAGAAIHQYGLPNLILAVVLAFVIGIVPLLTVLIWK